MSLFIGYICSSSKKSYIMESSKNPLEFASNSLAQHHQLQLHQIQDLTNRSSEMQLSLRRHLLLLAVSMLAIAVALHPTPATAQYIRWVFFVGVVLLMLGILSVSLVVYDLSMLVERARQSFHNEVNSAVKESRKAEMCVVLTLKRTTLFAKASVVLLAAALLSMSSYSVLTAL
jgi:hypothetical protein